MVTDAQPGELRGWWQAVEGGWNRFWFTPADPLVLGLMRWCCGLVVFYVHFVYGLELQQWMGRDAWADLSATNQWRTELPFYEQPDDWQHPDPLPLPDQASDSEKREILAYYDHWRADPRQVEHKGFLLFSFWYHVTDPDTMRLLHLLGLLFALLFAAGCCTRFTGALTWLWALSYIHRCPEGQFGLDGVIASLLLYLVIGPSGAALSFDALLTRWSALKNHRPLPPRVPSVSANVTLRLCQIHFCFIYGIAGAAKLMGEQWWNGEAIWGTLVNRELSPVHLGWYVDGVRFLAQHRWLLEIMQTGGSVFTLVLEMGLPFLIWNRRWRPLCIIGAVMLHTGIAILMNLTTFSLMMLTLVAAFLSPVAVQSVLERLGGGPVGKLAFDPAQAGQARRVRWLRVFDVWNRLEISEQPRLAMLQWTTPEGVVLTQWALWRYAFRHLRLLWPFAWWTWFA